MTKSRKNNLKVAFVASLIAGLFLILVYGTPNAFHILSYQIHESFFDDLMKEYVFINLFDVLISVLIFVVSFNILRNKLSRF